MVQPLILAEYSIGVGDSVTCSASVTDSNGGMAMAQTSDVIENRNPSVSSVSISPTSPSSNQVLTAVFRVPLTQMGNH